MGCNQFAASSCCLVVRIVCGGVPCTFFTLTHHCVFCFFTSHICVSVIDTDVLWYSKEPCIMRQRKYHIVINTYRCSATLSSTCHVTRPTVEMTPRSASPHLAVSCTRRRCCILFRALDIRCHQRSPWSGATVFGLCQWWWWNIQQCPCSTK